MQLGMIGLGRMGANLVRRLTKDGHACVVYDVNPDAVKAIQGKGVTAADSMEDLISKLHAPRAGWGWNRKPAGFFWLPLRPSISSDTNTTRTSR